MLPPPQAQLAAAGYAAADPAAAGEEGAHGLMTAAQAAEYAVHAAHAGLHPMADPSMAEQAQQEAHALAQHAEGVGLDPAALHAHFVGVPHTHEPGALAVELPAELQGELQAAAELAQGELPDELAGGLQGALQEAQAQQPLADPLQEQPAGVVP